MNYTSIYRKLIERARIRENHEYTERHHVIPRCLGGSDDVDNIVRLTPEEHYLAHQLLVKMHPGNRKLLSAATMMTANRKGNKVYGWLRRAWSERMKTHNPMHVYPERNAKKGRRDRGSFTLEERLS